jgi:hypothetical protein
MKSEGLGEKIGRKTPPKYRTMADNADWKVREDAAGAIKRLNDKHYNTYLPVRRE